jgi:conjugal transfer pilus assembly protein TraV
MIPRTPRRTDPTRLAPGTGAWRAAMGAAALLVVSACSLNPYNSQFMCAATANHGKCESVDAAYGDAVAKTATPSPRPTGASSAKTRRRTPDPLRSAPANGLPIMNVANTSGEARYLDAEYRKLAALVEEPIVPVVQPPTVLRTLILSYSSSDSVYLPRYVMYFAEAPKFVIGEYLNPESTPKTVFPTGQP